MRIQLMCRTSDCPGWRLLLLNQSHDSKSKGRIVLKENNEMFPEQGGIETGRQIQVVCPPQTKQGVDSRTQDPGSQTLCQVPWYVPSLFQVSWRRFWVPVGRSHFWPHDFSPPGWDSGLLSLSKGPWST